MTIISGMQYNSLYSLQFYNLEPIQNCLRNFYNIRKPLIVHTKLTSSLYNISSTLAVLSFSLHKILQSFHKIFNKSHKTLKGCNKCQAQIVIQKITNLEVITDWYTGFTNKVFKQTFIHRRIQNLHNILNQISYIHII